MQRRIKIFLFLSFIVCLCTCVQAVWGSDLALSHRGEHLSAGFSILVSWRIPGVQWCVCICICMWLPKCMCVCVCVCVCIFFLGVIDLSVIHRNVLNVQSLLRCLLCALPKDKTLMFYFPMSCLGIKAKKRKRWRCAKKDAPIRMPIDWKSWGEFYHNGFERIHKDIAQYSLKRTSFRFAWILKHFETKFFTVLLTSFNPA